MMGIEGDTPFVLTPKVSGRGKPVGDDKYVLLWLDGASWRARSDAFHYESGAIFRADPKQKNTNGAFMHVLGVIKPVPYMCFRYGKFLYDKSDKSLSTKSCINSLLACNGADESSYIIVVAVQGSIAFIASTKATSILIPKNKFSEKELAFAQSKLMLEPQEVAGAQDHLVQWLDKYSSEIKASAMLPKDFTIFDVKPSGFSGEPS